MENLQGGTLALEHRYDVLKRSGRHGFITLYHGQQDPFAKKVWVKAYDGLANVGAGVELFDRLKAASRQVSVLDAPGVLRIVDYGELAGGIPFVISERSEGVALSEILIREGTLSAETTAELLRRVAHVLSAAHQQGIAHGSVSPRWIYVAGERFNEAMVDHFQLAVTVDEILAADNAVMSAEAVSAFAPEMFARASDEQEPAGFRPVGDVWSLGILAYTALVGVHPFFEDELDASEGILRLRSEEARPLSELGVDPQISEVVERALSKEPAERWPSVEAFAEAFGAAVDPLQPKAASDKQAAALDVAARVPEAEEVPEAGPTPQPKTSAANAAPQRRPGRLDAPDEQQPGPSDLLLTAAIVLLFVTNLAWLFYVTGSAPSEAAANSAANKPAAGPVMIDR